VCVFKYTTHHTESRGDFTLLILSEEGNREVHWAVQKKSYIINGAYVRILIYETVHFTFDRKQKRVGN
jgi:hypothetical protein